MTSPNPQLQKAIVAVLKADSAVAAIVGPRVYDIPPAAPVFPYIAFGENQVLSDKADCYAGAEVNVVIQAWSTTPTREQVQSLASAMQAAIDDQEDALNASGKLTTQRVVAADFIRSETVLSDTGPEKQAAVRFRFLTEPT